MSELTPDQLEELKLCFSGGLWNLGSVQDNPEIQLGQWSIRQTQNGDRHFVGRNIREGGGAVSSKIMEWDKTTLRGKTRSGRVYQLNRGDAGIHMNAEYVWQAWCQRNAVTDWYHVDIDEETGEETPRQVTE